MRGLIFLSMIAAALYGFLVLTNHALRQENTKSALAVNDGANDANRTLRSWGNSLPALVIPPQRRLAEQLQAIVSNVEETAPTLSGEKTSGTPMARTLPSETTKQTPPQSSAQRSPFARVASKAATAKSATKWEPRHDRRAGSGDRRRRFGLFGRRFASFGATW